MCWYILDIRAHEIWLTFAFRTFRQVNMNWDEKIPFKNLSTKSEKVLVNKLRYERWANTCQKVKMNPLDLMKQLCVCLHPGVLLLITDPVSSVSLRTFLPESKAHHHSWLGRTGGRGWHLPSRFVVWFLRMCGWVVTDLVLRWRKLRFSRLSNVIRFMRGTELQSAAPRFFFWLTDRLSSGPGSWDLLCEGLGIPEYLPGALPEVTGALDQALTSLEGLWTQWDETGAESLRVCI